jgi:hypothetical protein
LARSLHRVSAEEILGRVDDEVRALILWALVLAGWAVVGLVRDVNAEDVVAVNACMKFNKTVSDARVGVLTEVQLQRRLQAVFEVGRYSRHPLAREAFFELQHARLGSSDEAGQEAARQGHGALPHRVFIIITLG